MPRSQRLFIATLIGLIAGVLTAMKERAASYPSDFTLSWYAARAVLRGADPYPLIGPGRTFAFDFPYLYPLPAAVVSVPLAPFPAWMASALFIALGVACLAWALSAHGPAPLIGLASASVYFAHLSVQWSPLLTAAAVIPPLGILFAAKPTIGFALFCYRPSRWALFGGIGVVALSFLLQPHWLASWQTALTDRVGYAAPVLQPGGIIALACLLRWRRPEARLVAVLACVPQTPSLYETVPLLLVLRTAPEAIAFVVLSYAVQAWLAFDLSPVYATGLAQSARVIALTLYPVATLMVLRRPNEGTAPAWLESAIRYFPPALRGRTAPSPHLP